MFFVSKAIDDKLLEDSLSAQHKILREREKINTLLTGKTPPNIYGFNSLLGHMDHLTMTSGDEERLLKTHLVGPVHSMPLDWLRLLAMTKGAQASNGGSGISPEAFGAILEMQTYDPVQSTVYGNWFASYGSGDVVPGAWFVRAIEEITKEKPLHQPGDLISLISGSFVSVALAIVCLKIMENHRRKLYEIFSLTHNYATRDENNASQKSVTVRDFSPILEALDTSIHSLEEEVLQELSKPSANPMFVFRNNQVHAESNSSFLGFGLRMAIVRALHTTSLSHAYLLGSARTIASTQTEGADFAIQPTKILSAHGKSIESIVSSVGGDYSIVESDGVEDVGDLSLVGAVKLIRAQNIIGRSITVFSHIIENTEDTVIYLPEDHSLTHNRLGIDFSALSKAVVSAPC